MVYNQHIYRIYKCIVVYRFVILSCSKKTMVKENGYFLTVAYKFQDLSYIPENNE